MAFLQQNTPLGEDYKLRMLYSYNTLQELKDPMIHLSKGCQFNKNEITDEKKLTKCPVCLENIGLDDLKQDFELFNAIQTKTEKQLVYSNNQLFKLPKQIYCDPKNNISSIALVRELQQKYYQQLYRDQFNKLQFEAIQQMNEKRNTQLIELIKQLPKEEYSPVLFGVINYKLILFYHQYKLKIQLDLFDNSSQKIKQKLSSKFGEIEQIYYYNNILFFVINKNNQAELFYGNIEQVFNGQYVGQFHITSLKNCVIQQTAKLVEFNGALAMLGAQKSFLIFTPQNQPVFQDFKRQIFDLQKDSLLDIVNGKHVLFANCKEVPRSKNDHTLEAFADYYYSDISVENNNNEKEILSKSFLFNDYLIFGDRMILYRSQNLNNEKIQAQSIGFQVSKKDKIPVLNQSITIKSNASYLEPVTIITTRKLIGLISCKLIGLRMKLTNNQTQSEHIFPALQVYNHQSQAMEIELI